MTSSGKLCHLHVGNPGKSLSSIWVIHLQKMLHFSSINRGGFRWVLATPHDSRYISARHRASRWLYPTRLRGAFLDETGMPSASGIYIYAYIVDSLMISAHYCRHIFFVFLFCVLLRNRSLNMFSFGRNSLINAEFWMSKICKMSQLTID